MAIRFYINGTQGGKDGLEVTPDNPIIADGLFPAGSTPATQTVKVYARADAGESYTGVLIGTNQEDNAKFTITSINGNLIELEGSSNTYGTSFVQSITDINTEISLQFMATAAEIGSIDTSLVLYGIPLNWQV